MNRLRLLAATAALLMIAPVALIFLYAGIDALYNEAARLVGVDLVAAPGPAFFVVVLLFALSTVFGAPVFIQMMNEARDADSRKSRR